MSLGPAQQLSTVPDLYGYTQEEAEAMLQEAGLVIGEVTQDYSSIAPAGRVIAQGTAEGSEVAKGTSVDITISIGPNETVQEETSTGPAGTVSISQPFAKAEENGKLTVIAIDGSGSQTTIYENTVSYSTFSSLGGAIKVGYPAGTVRVEVYLDDKLIMSEDING